MSLKYRNNESLLNQNYPQYGIIYDDLDLLNISNEKFELKFLNDTEDIFSEAHVYSFNGDLISSVYGIPIQSHTEYNSSYINISDIFRTTGILNGSFKLIINTIFPIFGKPDNQDPEFKNLPLYLDEVSPTRDEVKIKILDIEYINKFKTNFQNLTSLNLLNNMVLNFGGNNIYNIINFRFDQEEQDVFYFKLFNPIDDNIQELSKCWLGVELMDSYVDTILLTKNPITQITNSIGGPNFNLDFDENASRATVFKSWNDLLDSNTETTQEIINRVISGSASATLNIDFSRLENHVFYGKATEKIDIFKAKLEQIEQYDLNSTELLNTSSSNSMMVLSGITQNNDRINVIKNNFDPFEKWLYYHNTGSLFTHGDVCDIYPYPKYISGSVQYVYHTTSSQGQNWYTESFASASLYDEDNYKSLWWMIPEHIVMDENNSEYVSFVNMTGHHFDSLYAYINALTKIHEKEEHPELGPSDDILYHIAKSFGWELQNTRQLSELWLYELGTDNSGSIQESSGMPVRSHKDQTMQIWRRIVNNLPYLLKTKGTDRSVKALMSIYGIPKTLLSIKEYGGPGSDDDIPMLIEDRFAYKLKITGSDCFVQIPSYTYTASQFGFGNIGLCETESLPETIRDADTIEFRFSTNVSSSIDATPIFIQTDISSNPVMISLISAELQGYSASVSGSMGYGSILVESIPAVGVGDSSNINSSSLLPLYDGDLWTIRITDLEPNESIGDIQVDIAKAADSLYGKVTYSESIVITQAERNISAVNIFGNYILNLFDRSLSGFSQGTFDGYIQNYKEYFTTYSFDTFLDHVKNPGAYHTDDVSGSYYSLLNYYPFGSDLNRQELVESSSILSVQPNRNLNSSVATAVNFTGDQTTQYESINETYYIPVPIIGGNANRDEKIRIEDNTLLYELSPDTKSELSEFDDKPTDSNRLAIVFSQTDQVNRDIYNHMGFEDFDSWIGDPEYEFSDSYKVLDYKRNEYFQKYVQPNNINGFINVLSLYDYTFFEQLKQLVPGRADLITGILIEPNILHRSKVQITKRPTVENPQWDDTILARIDSASGEFTQLEENIEHDRTVEVNGIYLKGKVNYETSSSINGIYLTGSIIDPYIPTSSLFYHTTSSYGIVDVFEKPHTGSVEDIIDGFPICNKYLKKECLYDAYLLKDSLLLDGYFNSIQNWYTASSVEIYFETGSLDNINQKRFINGIILSQSNYISQSIVTEQNLEYFIRIFAKPNPSGSISVLEIDVNSVNISNENIKYWISGSQEWVNEYRTNFTGSGEDEIKLLALNEMVLYSVEVYPYKTKWQEGWAILANEQLNLPSECLYVPWNYQIEECEGRNRSRFIGSKLEGPGINIDSPNTVDGGPVVTITEVNPNLLDIDSGEGNGNLRVE